MKRPSGSATSGALVMAALLWGAVTGTRSIACLAIGLALTSLLRGRANHLTRLTTPVQGLLLLGCGLVALFLVASSVFSPDDAWGDRPLHRAWAVLGSGCLLLAAARTHLHEPEGGMPVTLGLGLICLLACGSVLSGPLYVGAVVSYLPFMFLALRAADPDRTRWLDLGRRHSAALASSIVVTAISTALLLAAIPGLYDRASGWALRLMDDEFEVGFHDGPMTLGSLHHMLDSDEIVMRVEGDVGERLRGNVYTRYASALWLADDGFGARPEVVADLELAASFETEGKRDVAVIRHAGGDSDRFFLPLDAERVGLSPSRVTVDAYGIARPTGDGRPEQARLQLGPSRRLPPVAPRATDRQLPDPLRQPLEAIAADWTKHAATPIERVRALQSRLETDYTYSLQFERGERPGDAARTTSQLSDPILEFLLEDRQGHCEYFASALALLARASGLPARMVTGYRVYERNPLGNYHIVRERHAHAWAEVYLGESGWRAFDPSPMQSFEGAALATTPTLVALWDWLAVLLRRSGPTPLLVLLVVVFGGIQLRGLVAERRRSGASRRPSSTRPRYVGELLSQLRKQGWRRTDGETLEGLARRLRVASACTTPSTSSAASSGSADTLLERAAALRYGGQGDAPTLERDIREWIAQRSAGA